MNRDRLIDLSIDIKWEKEREREKVCAFMCEGENLRMCVGERERETEKKKEKSETWFDGHRYLLRFGSTMHKFIVNVLFKTCLG